MFKNSYLRCLRLDFDGGFGFGIVTFRPSFRVIKYISLKKNSFAIVRSDGNIFR